MNALDMESCKNVDVKMLKSNTNNKNNLFRNYKIILNKS